MAAVGMKSCVFLPDTWLTVARESSSRRSMLEETSQLTESWRTHSHMSLISHNFNVVQFSWLYLRPCVTVEKDHISKHENIHHTSHKYTAQQSFSLSSVCITGHLLKIDTVNTTETQLKHDKNNNLIKCRAFITVSKSANNIVTGITLFLLLCWKYNTI